MATEATTSTTTGGAPAARSYWHITWRRFRGHRLGMVGLCVVAVLFLVAFLSPILANEQPILCRFDGGFYYPAVVDLVHQVPGTSLIIQKQRPYRLATFDFKREFDPERGDWALWTPVRYGPREIAAEPLAGPSSRHWLGTDQSGRDVLSRMVHGTVVSMKVGFLSMGIAVILGLVFGCIAGYAGGIADLVISRFIEVVQCFPAFFLILAVLAWFPPSIENVMIVIGLTRWVGIARFARGEILRIRETDYALAARSLGVRPAQLVLRHLLPNALAPGAGQRDLRHRGVHPDRSGTLLARLRRPAARRLLGHDPPLRLREPVHRRPHDSPRLRGDLPRGAEFQPRRRYAEGCNRPAAPGRTGLTPPGSPPRR